MNLILARHPALGTWVVFDHDEVAEGKRSIRAWDVHGPRSADITIEEARAAVAEANQRVKETLSS
jgi:hypothetical protein